MSPAVVADVGNTRIKWGRCHVGGVGDSIALPPDDPNAWQRQWDAWQLEVGAAWAVTAVHPQRCARLMEWLRQRGQAVRQIDSWQSLPLEVHLDRPDYVGMDRLLDAVAVNSRRPAGVPAVVIDAGSAITVDWIDETGAFAGGAICPGLRLLALTLHEHTALLPLVEPPRQPPELPGKTTPDAMRAGVYWAAVGAVAALVEQYRRRAAVPPHVFLTGGDGAVLQEAIPEGELWPLMTLEGIRLAAEALP